MEIFPTSPIWADITREQEWNENISHYDSGVRQGSTNWFRPLYRYGINGRNFNEVKQVVLHTFVNSMKMMTTPFLMKDPYDHLANGITQAATTTMDSGSGFYFVDARSWRFIPDSAELLVTDGTSGALVNGTEFILSADNGWCSVQVVVTSTWVASFEFFRKVAFSSQYSERSALWNQFGASFSIEELLPS